MSKRRKAPIKAKAPTKVARRRDVVAPIKEVITPGGAFRKLATRVINLLQRFK